MIRAQVESSPRSPSFRAAAPLPIELWSLASPAQRLRCLRAWPTVARAVTKLMGAFVTFSDNDAGSKLAGQPGAGRGRQAGRQPPGVADAPAVPTQPHEGSLGALPLPLGPCGDLRRHGAQHQHRPRGLPAPSFIAGFPTERVPKMPLSGVSTRSGDLIWFTFKALDGTMTDVFIHLIAYQLAV